MIPKWNRFLEKIMPNRDIPHLVANLGAAEMFYAAFASSPGGGRGRFSIAHHGLRLLAIRANTTASADVAVYIVKAFR